MTIAGGLANKGTLNCAGSGSIVVAQPSVIDLSQGTILNGSSTSLSVPSGSLVLVSADNDPSSSFGSYSNAGMTHVVGTPLIIADNQGFGGWGDIDDMVVCAGTVSPQRRFILIRLRTPF